MSFQRWGRLQRYGTVEEIITAGNQAGWQGYGTVSTEPGTVSLASTTLTAATGAPGLAGALWTFGVTGGQTMRAGGDFQLKDSTLKTVLDVHVSTNIDAVGETCDGIGAATPAG